ncbi:AMP-binding protein [Streptomyces sp. NPDC005355]|uniref:class I adenylate-forming enzyme family protein n=2 Tax=unclassified Streptomyces TaxID=2593676 RepID=UPI0033A881C7
MACVIVALLPCRNTSLTTRSQEASMHLSVLPDARALRDPGGQAIADDTATLTNAQFAEAVRRAAAALSGLGVGRGDVVAIMLPNTVEFITAMFAAWRLGAAVTPVNPSLTAVEVEYQLGDVSAKVVVTTAEGAAKVSGAAAVCTDLSAPSGAGSVDVMAEYRREDLALVIYTSGTTGRPKGVMLDHANIAAMCAMTIEAFELDAAAHSLLVLPLFHVNGIVVSTLSPLLAGGRATVAGRFDAASFFPRVAVARPTYFSAVPTIYAKLADLPADSPVDTSSLRFAICGAAPASAELLRKFEARFGVPVIEGYGLSEGTCASTVNPLHGERKAGTVGLPLPGQSIRVVDPDGSETTGGAAGEVLIQGPNVMRGYLNRPQETAATIRDGWLHTGDIGCLGEDGYLVLVGRTKDMVIRGGENIYPKEIEEVVHQLSDVLEAAVVGRPHPVLGEEPVLFVSLVTGGVLDEEGIYRHLRGRLSKFKLPAAIFIVDAIPKNAVGKIDKPTLRTRLGPTGLTS